MPRDTILILGSYRQTVSVVRSVALAGLRTLVGVEQPRTMARFSRFAHEHWRHPDLVQDPAAFAAAMRDLLARRDDIRWVFPVGEDEIRWLDGPGAAVVDRERVVAADAGAVATCLDKERLYELARGIGVPFAAYAVARDESELARAIEEIGYPLVVKPRTSVVEVAGHRANVLRDAAGLARRLPRWPQGVDALIVQRLAPGMRHNCQFVAHEGRLLAYFEQRVLRTNRSDLTRFAVESVSIAPTALLRERTARLVARLGYSGAGCAQFLLDDGGAAMLLEVNPRLDANCELARRCGVDFPRLAYEVQLHRRGEGPVPAALPESYELGRRCHWMLGDVQGLLHEAGEEGLAQSLGWALRIAMAAVRSDIHLVGWWRDPLPEVYAVAESVPLPRWRR